MSRLIIEPVELMLPPAVRAELERKRAREAAENLRAKLLVGDGAEQMGLPRRFRRKAERNRERITRRVVRQARREASHCCTCGPCCSEHVR